MFSLVGEIEMDKKDEFKSLKKEIKRRVASLPKERQKKYYFTFSLKLISLTVLVVGLIAYPIEYFTTPYFNEWIDVNVRSTENIFSLSVVLMIFVRVGIVFIPSGIIFCLLFEKYLSPQILLKKIEELEAS